MTRARPTSRCAQKVWIFADGNRVASVQIRAYAQLRHAGLEHSLAATKGQEMDDPVSRESIFSAGAIGEPAPQMGFSEVFISKSTSAPIESVLSVEGYWTWCVRSCVPFPTSSSRGPREGRARRLPRHVELVGRLFSWRSIRKLSRCPPERGAGH